MIGRRSTAVGARVGRRSQRRCCWPSTRVTAGWGGGPSGQRPSGSRRPRHKRAAAREGRGRGDRGDVAPRVAPSRPAMAGPIAKPRDAAMPMRPKATRRIGLAAGEVGDVGVGDRDVAAGGAVDRPGREHDEQGMVIVAPANSERRHGQGEGEQEQQPREHGAGLAEQAPGGDRGDPTSGRAPARRRAGTRSRWPRRGRRSTRPHRSR